MLIHMLLLFFQNFSVFSPRAAATNTQDEAHPQVPDNMFWAEHKSVSPNNNKAEMLFCLVICLNSRIISIVPYPDSAEDWRGI